MVLAQGAVESCSALGLGLNFLNAKAIWHDYGILVARSGRTWYDRRNFMAQVIATSRARAKSRPIQGMTVMRES